MNDKIRPGVFVDYIGPSREGLKHGDSKLVNDADEFGVRLVGVRGYFDYCDFVISVPSFEKLSSEARSELIEAFMGSDKVVQMKDPKTSIWKDLRNTKLLVFHRHGVYRIKPEKLQSLDVLYQKKAVAQHMLLEAEREINLAKKEVKND